MAGKLNGVIPAVTPSGSLYVWVSMSFAIPGIVSPSCSDVILQQCSTTSTKQYRDNDVTLGQCSAISKWVGATIYVAANDLPGTLSISLNTYVSLSWRHLQRLWLSCLVPMWCFWQFVATIRTNFDKCSNLIIGAFLSSKNWHESTVTKQSIMVCRVDRHRDREQMGCMILCESFHIIP